MKGEKGENGKGGKEKKEVRWVGGKGDDCFTVEKEMGREGRRGGGGGRR